LAFKYLDFDGKKYVVVNSITSLLKSYITKVAVRSTPFNFKQRIGKKKN
jgi:hypothetical protein